MSLVVVNGALCKCTFGAAPCSLIVPPSSKVLAGNMPAATIMDNKPTNIPGFGMCSSMSNPAVSAATAAALGVLTPQPCTPVISAPWTPGSASVLLGGNPALTNSSKAFCMYGGTIEIVNLPQSSVNCK